MELPRSRKTQLLQAIKVLFLYVLVPALILACLAQPIGEAVRRTAYTGACGILLAALAAVGLNWAIYRLIRREKPTLLVFAHGVFCLEAVAFIEYEALPRSLSLASTLAVVEGCLMLAFLFLLSYWFASRRSRPAHTIAVGLWIIIGIIAFFMLYRILRDFEIGHVDLDTWITLGILLALFPAAFVYRIRSSFRRKAARRRATGLVNGQIIQILGETRLDRDDEPVTDYHARVRYTVDGVAYETNAEISGFSIRKFGRKTFIGQELPVYFDPADPSCAFTNRIDRHFFDGRDPAGREDSSRGGPGENDQKGAESEDV